MTNVERERQSEPQEDLLKWAIRYVLIPVTVAALAGVFALAVVDRQFELQNRPLDEDTINSIFATMTAVAPQSQPGSSTVPNTPTIAPTPTKEASVAETGEPISELPQENGPSSGQAPICGQVPVGWQLYTVQPGNTLFSLAQQTGTTVATIQQVNCLYDSLKAYEQIWLPTTISKPIEVTAVIEETAVVALTPIVKETAVVDPIITETPTITVTEPVGLPDLVNSPGSVPNISVSCPDGPGTCVTSVNLAISNVGLADADLFNIQVWLDPAQSVVLNQAVERLMPGQSVSFSLLSPPGGNCYDPNCTVCVIVDSREGVVEEDETNNQFCTTFPG